MLSLEGGISIEELLPVQTTFPPALLRSNWYVTVRYTMCWFDVLLYCKMITPIALTPPVCHITIIAK